MSKTTTGDIRDILEANQIYGLGGALEENCEEFGYTSPLGEDFNFVLYYEDNAESLSEALTEYAEAFDPEEHAAHWYNARETVSDVPDSLEDLLTDAKDIKAALLKAAEEVEAAVNGKASGEEGISPRKMTDADRRDLLWHVNEYLSELLKHEYEDEDDFEEQFGPTDTLEDAVGLLLNYVDDPWDLAIFIHYMEAFPGSRQELMELFGVEEEAENVAAEPRPYSLWGRIGMTVRLSEDEHESIVNLLKEGRSEEASAMVFTLFKIRGIFDGDSYVPDECAEETFGEDASACELCFDF